MESTDIQGNVLAPFKKPHMRFVMVRLPRRVEDAKAWLAAINRHVSSSDEVARHNEEWQPGDRETWTALGLTRSGLERLGLTNLERDLAEHHAFLAGPEARARDLGDVGEENEPAGWLFGSQANRVDAVVTIAADDGSDVATRLDDVRAISVDHHASIAYEQPAERLPGNQEHFGFKDGGGQPRVKGFDADGDVELSEFVLDGGAPQWLPGASFQVVRLLAQDVHAWRAAAGDEEDRIGRTRDGLELPSTPPSSHVGKTRPVADFETNQRRLLRRGIPYGPPYDEAPDADRGLVFNAFMASIDRQYEFIQRLWANRSDFPSAGTGWDPVIGGPDPEEQRYHDAKGVAPAWPPRHVRTRGAVYAVALSLPALSGIAGESNGRTASRY
jgi:Dyp-type peroxidase family